MRLWVRRSLVGVAALAVLVVAGLAGYQQDRWAIGRLQS
jgi:hypothetical protein